jgi:hypothetical protein
VADRLKEFHNEQADEFFALCVAAAAASAASAPAKLPFQCLAPTKKLGFKDFG